MARTSNSRLVYLFALLLFVGGVGYMVYSGVSSNSSYFLNVSEALAMPAEDVKSTRLFGTVADREIIRPDDHLGVTFVLADEKIPDAVIRVEYLGVVPDTFQPGAEVIVEGDMREHGFFAKTMMTKCPSKYEKDNRA